MKEGGAAAPAGRVRKRPNSLEDNPMDYESHDDIIEDMLESPQWSAGNAGILYPGRPLAVTLTRPENQFWVCARYSFNEQQAFDVFYAFLCMRKLFYSQHPELGACTSISR